MYFILIFYTIIHSDNYPSAIAFLLPLNRGLLHRCCGLPCSKAINELRHTLNEQQRALPKLRRTLTVLRHIFNGYVVSYDLHAAPKYASSHHNELRRTQATVLRIINELRRTQICYTAPRILYFKPLDWRGI